MKAPQFRSYSGYATYTMASADHAWPVANNLGSPLAGDLRICALYNSFGGIGGTPNQVGERTEVPRWNLLWGDNGGLDDGWHVYWQWYNPAFDGQTDNFYLVKEPPGTDLDGLHGFRIVLSISGVNKIEPFVLDDTDPTGGASGTGYVELHGTNPNVQTTGVIAPTADMMLLFLTASRHNTGANNIYHVCPDLTLRGRTQPVFPPNDPNSSATPGTPNGRGDVAACHTTTLAAPSTVRGTVTRQVWRYLGDPEWEELATLHATRPDLELNSDSFRVAIRGTTPGAVAMI